MDRKELKRQAKEAMGRARPAAFWVSLVMLLIMAALGLLGANLTGELAAMRTMAEAAMEGRIIYVPAAGTNGIVGWILSVALEIMGLEISVGFVIYSMRVWRRENASIGNLFDGFGVFFRAIWIQLLPSLLVSLWSQLYVVPMAMMVAMTGHMIWAVIALPLLIPAIRAGFSYRQAAYIMLDNPGLSCLQCIGLSRVIMDGHKWECFVLDLSFLGWALLCAFLPVVGLILLVWVTAYMNVAYAGYYDMVMGEYLRLNAPPVQPQNPAF